MMKCIFSQQMLLLMVFKLSATRLPLFSSINTAMPYFNPAYSGLDNKTSLAINSSFKGAEFYRENYNNGILYADPFDNSKCYNLIFNTPLRLGSKRHSGIGFIYTRFNDGRYQTSNNFAVNFSHPIARFKKGEIQLGISGSYTQFNFELTKFFRGNLDYANNFDDFKNNTINYNVGFMFNNYSNTFNCGVALVNAKTIEATAYSKDNTLKLLYQVMPHFTFNASLKSRLGKNVTIRNSFIATVQAKNIKNKDLMLQSILYCKAIGLGLQFYSTGPKIGPTIAYNNRRFEMTYTYLYDFYLKWGVVGIHQLGLKYCFNIPK